MNADSADAGALELLQKGELPADHWDWECGAGFRFARDEDVQEESAAKALTRRCVPMVNGMQYLVLASSLGVQVLGMVSM